jgi:hypothetical protein
MFKRSSSKADDTAASASAAADAGVDLSDLNIPPRVILPDRVRRNAPKLYTVPLAPLRCSFGLVTQDPKSGTKTFQEVVLEELQRQKADVAIVFCIRRAGCGSCREHAVQLTQDFKARNPENSKIAVIGVIKDAHDHDDILELYNDYFAQHPLYHDENWTLGTAIGGRPLQITDLMRTFVTSRTRFLKKKIKCQIGQA